MIRHISLVSGALLACGLVNNVSALQTNAVFEVASVRRNVSGISSMTLLDFTGRGGRFLATRATLHALILRGYDIRDYQLVGGPRWVRTGRFDIRAVAGADDVPADRIRLMVQRLMAERFGLVLRRESRERDIYVLKLARSDGRLGPDLRKASEDCRANRPSTPLEVVAGMPRPSNGGQPTLGGACEPVDALANLLQRRLQTLVVDGTGLTGMWDYVVSLRPDRSQSGAAPVVPGEELSLFTALREQLGLELERERGPIEVLVIESVHPPTEN